MKSWETVDPFSRLRGSTFAWCKECERTHRTKSWRKCGWLCPTEGCRGDVVGAYPWSPASLPRRNNPHYPEKPVKGKRYPLNAGTIDPDFWHTLFYRGIR
jgi:hypothetical protein